MNNDQVYWIIIRQNFIEKSVDYINIEVYNIRHL